MKRKESSHDPDGVESLLERVVQQAFLQEAHNLEVTGGESAKCGACLRAIAQRRLEARDAMKPAESLPCGCRSAPCWGHSESSSAPIRPGARATACDRCGGSGDYGPGVGGACQKCIGSGSRLS